MLAKEFQTYDLADDKAYPVPRFVLEALFKLEGVIKTRIVHHASGAHSECAILPGRVCVFSDLKVIIPLETEVSDVKA